MATSSDHKKKKSEASGWDVVLYVVLALVAVGVLYYLFESLAGATKSNNGRRDTGKMAMYVIAAIMAAIILYVIVKGVRDGYTQTMAGEPWLVQTTKTANRMSVIPGRSIPRSTDGRFGLEFSYSLWLYINEWGSASRYKGGMHHILHKGSITAIPDQCPGLWLKRDTNVLVVKINTFHKNNSPECRVQSGNPGQPDTASHEKCFLEVCQIPNIPVHKWVHLTVSVINRNVDIYVNGFLKKRCLLKGLPRQNDGDVYLNAFGGFDGFMSRVRYFNYALPVWKIESVISQGPSDAPCTLTGETPPYLARDWWETTRYSDAPPSPGF
jgi:hypothetical protein